MSERYVTGIANPTGEVVINGLRVQITAEMVEDVWDVRSVMATAWDLYVNPWKRPDSIDWPSFTPFPSVDRAFVACSVARRRIRVAWSVLRGAHTVEPD